MKKNEVMQYLNDIKILFPIFEKEERLYFERFKSNVLKQSNIDKSLTYANCIRSFGEPKDIVFSFYDEVDTQIIVKNLKKRKYMKIITFTIMVFVIVITLIITIFFINAYNEAKKSYIEREETEIIQSE